MVNRYGCAFFNTSVGGSRLNPFYYFSSFDDLQVTQLEFLNHPQSLQDCLALKSNSVISWSRMPLRLSLQFG
ncbi:hypothetical protein J6590_061223 [Homalodisca vitripennis]|nr:hypothetical protein J6590_061223 [Homalodisca vitripennis]